MATEIKPPVRWWNSAVGSPTIFLAGSIEMGKAEDWQSRVARELAATSAVLINPRRDDWDDTWVQSIDHPLFREQVRWELVGLELAKYVLVYFAPDTFAPITLFELGLLTKRPGAVVVCCPDGFYRKGNVDVVCQWFGITTVDTLEDLIKTGRRLASGRSGEGYEPLS